MGCDIHCYLERKDELQDKPHYWSFGGCINPGRNYVLFTVLAGVRDYGDGPRPLFQPRGIAPHLGWNASDDLGLYVTMDEKQAEQEGWTTLERAARWVQQGKSKWMDYDKVLASNDFPAHVKYPRVTDPDWHSHSWVTAAELKAAIDKVQNETPYKVSVEWKALLAALLVLGGENGENARMVFWFDN